MLRQPDMPFVLVIIPRLEDENIVKKFAKWLCGLNDTSGEIPKEEHIHTLNQDPRAKIMLTILLVLVVGVAVFLYVFFSIATKYIYPFPSN